ncbi:hypothetical protein [Candidatus Palauibacter sp.]
MRYSKLPAADTHLGQRGITYPTLRPSGDGEEGTDCARRDPR